MPFGHFSRISAGYVRERTSQNASSNSCRFFSRATFCVSLSRKDPRKVARVFVEGLTVAVCYTAKWLKSSSRHLGE